MFISGLVNERKYDEGTALAVGSRFIAEELERFFHDPVHVAFGFSEELVLPADMLEAAISQATGDADALLCARYSDITGFLWLDEEAVVGGHDLIEIFGSHIGEYGALAIKDSTEGILDLGELCAEFDAEGTVIHEASLGIRGS